MIRADRTHVLHLGPKLTVYTGEKTSSGYYHEVIDTKGNNITKEIVIPYEGMILSPERVYIGYTAETIGSSADLVFQVDGLRELTKYGLTVTGGSEYGQGFSGKYPLLLHCVQPVKIYPNMEIARVFYTTTKCVWDEYFETSCPWGSHGRIK